MQDADALQQYGETSLELTGTRARLSPFGKAPPSACPELQRRVPDRGARLPRRLYYLYQLY